MPNETPASMQLMESSSLSSSPSSYWHGPRVQPSTPPSSTLLYSKPPTIASYPARAFLSTGSLIKYEWAVYEIRVNEYRMYILNKMKAISWRREKYGFRKPGASEKGTWWASKAGKSSLREGEKEPMDRSFWKNTVTKG